jgi:hypothetical protein
VFKTEVNEIDGIVNAQSKFEFWINNNYRKICNNTKNKNNITTNKKHKIIALKNNNKYITTATDKNCGVCIIEKEWIENEIYKILNSNQFTITGDTIENTINNNKKIINEWYDNNIEKIENWINTFEIWKIKDDLKNDKLPNIYILPKIHKKYLKPRIIVNVGKNKQTSFLSYWFGNEIWNLIYYTQNNIIGRDINIHNSSYLINKIQAIKSKKEIKYLYIIGILKIFTIM